jgi:hypothetical protein
MADLRAYLKFNDGSPPSGFTDTSTYANDFTFPFSTPNVYTGYEGLAMGFGYSRSILSPLPNPIYDFRNDVGLVFEWYHNFSTTDYKRSQIKIIEDIGSTIKVDLTTYTDGTYVIDFFNQYHEEVAPTPFTTDGWYKITAKWYRDSSIWRYLLYINDVLDYQVSDAYSARGFYNVDAGLYAAVETDGSTNSAVIDEVKISIYAYSGTEPGTGTPALEESISDLIYLPDYYVWRFTVKDGEVTSEYDNRIFDAFRTGEVVSYDPFANYAYKTIEDIIRIRSLLDNSRTRDSGGVTNTEYEDTISDFLVNVDDLLQTPNLFMGFTDEIALEDLVTPNGTFSESLSEIVLFIPVKDEPNISFNTYSFNSRINAVSEYTNYNFNSYTVYQNRAYGASSEGFYLLEGCTDNEDPIVVKLRTAAMDFGTSNLKSIPQVYLGIAQDSSIIMKVAVDGKAETYHKLDLSTNHLGTQRIKLPKGHIGRWFQFELVSETVSEFNLDSIEFYLMPFRRKI